MNVKAVKISIRTGYTDWDDYTGNCSSFNWGYVSIGDKEPVIHYWSEYTGGSLQGPEQDLAEFLRVVLATVGVIADVTLIAEDET